MFGDFFEGIKEMNKDICEKLDFISQLLEELIVAVQESTMDHYGDGR